LRRRFTVLSEMGFLAGNGDVEWISLSGEPMTVTEWETPSLSTLGMLLSTGDRSARGRQTRLGVLFNRSKSRQFFTLPCEGEPGWRQLTPDGATKTTGHATVEPRSIAFFVEN
jgi:glycogen operon protein